MRGRKRTPTRLLKMRGAFEKHPEREREREGEPELPLGVGEAPAHFDAAQRECWGELAADGAAWLTLAYRKNLEVAAELLAKSRRDGLKSVELGLYLKALSDLHFGAANAKAKVSKHDGDQDEKALLA